MKLIFVTHPDAEQVDSKGSFRPLTKKGIQDLHLVSEEILSYLGKNNLSEISLISSSAIRCLQTAFEVGNHLRKIGKIKVFDKIQTLGSLNQDEVNRVFSLHSFLEDLLDESQVNPKLTIVFLHADIGKVFRQQIPESEVDKDGYFNLKPVMVVLEVFENKGLIDFEVLSYQSSFHLKVY